MEDIEVEREAWHRAHDAITFQGIEYPEIKLSGWVNISDDQVVSQVRENIKRGHAQLKPHMQVKEPIMLACGGPSLTRFLPTIRKKRDAGRKIAATNATHDYLLEHGIKPSIHVMIDGREHHRRFIENSIPECIYFVASRCHPSVFDELEKKNRNIIIFHTNCEGVEPVLDEYYFGHNYEFIAGGSTVGLRAIWLLRVIGRIRQEIYGLDSCFLGKSHHAYDQPENDKNKAIEIIPDLQGKGRKRFWSTPWMISQAKEFQEMIKAVGNEIDLAVYGPGLIAHMVRTGARVGDEDGRSGLEVL